MHVGEHSTKSTVKISDLKPGEYIITDLQGPYVRSRNQEKYSQIFLDLISKRVWVVRLKKKSESDKAIEKILLDAKTRSRKEVRIVRTDGDGIFGRSKSFQELKEKEKFLHERPAPYDHRQNARIDRECRTLLEGANTALDQSGAPSNLWGDAADHFIFTSNMLPRIVLVDKEGAKAPPKSPNSILENRDIHFNLKHVVALAHRQHATYQQREEKGEKHQDNKNRLMVLC